MIRKQQIEFDFIRATILSAICCGISFAFALSAQSAEPDNGWGALAPLFEIPAEYRADFGNWKSPLIKSDGSRVSNADQWPARRAEILSYWQRLLGPLPPRLERPRIKLLERTQRGECLQYHVQVEIAPQDRYTDGYLIVPPGEGPFPAVLVTFYEPRTGIGTGASGQNTHDFGWQLAQRGILTLSIGTPGMIEEPLRNVRSLLPDEGRRYGGQPLAFLAYVAANAHTALLQSPLVDPRRTGVTGLSYGGKWAMFASLLDDRFACAVWSDPGIVWDETNTNVNYYEPWYLGYDPATLRKPGPPSEERPRTGLYKQLVDSQQDLVEFHALMAPRHLLVSGGTEDKPVRWRALNHLQEVNKLLGAPHQVGLSARPTHVPTAEALEQTLQFFEQCFFHRSSANQAH